MDKENIRSELLSNEIQNPNLASMRFETSLFAANAFNKFGEILEVSGHLIGEDRKLGASLFDFGSDEVYGVSLLLRVAGQLTQNCAELFREKQSYAAAALLRQIVEVEYLAWAFENRHKDAETWLRSDKRLRQDIFKPAKLREAASGKFRGKDYGYHRELGGHPTPTSMKLFTDDVLVIQLLMSDLNGHVSGIWGHFVGWGQKQKELVPVFTQLDKLGKETGEKLSTWRSDDPLADLGPPP